MDTGENLLFNRTVLFGALVGSIILVLVYILKLFNTEEKAEEQNKNEKGTQHSEKKKESVGSKSKKKVSEGKWSTKADKQGFTHPWLIKSLKGHTGEVLDTDFSSNNKYLISCADEDPGVNTEGSSDSSTKESSRPPSVEPSPKTKGLSRRQRKNRRKEDISPEIRKKTKKKPESRPTKRQALLAPLKIWIKLKMDEAKLFQLLSKYQLSSQEMLAMGYPMTVDKRTGHVLIYKAAHKAKDKVGETKFDVNAEEFVPQTNSNKASSDEYDSGQGSGNSSDSGENLDEAELRARNHYNYRYKPQLQEQVMRARLQYSFYVCAPVSIRVCPTNIGYPMKQPSLTVTFFKAATFYEEALLMKSAQRPVLPAVPTNTYFTRSCVRCSEEFVTTHAGYITRESCTYHWGKLHHVYPRMEPEYTCCQARCGSKGCSEAPCHVWNGIEEGPNHLIGFVQTKRRKCMPPDGNYGVYAMDCEMCYTVKGLELTKVTVVGTDGRVVYDSFVKPECDVVDYNTKFSGITSRDLRCAKSLKDVQSDLMGFISADSILIGHGLENDLRALKMVHTKVIDTSYSFPHHMGLPYRRSLKQLARYVLGKKIQVDKHNSCEDALTSLELVLSLVWKETQ